MTAARKLQRSRFAPPPPPPPRLAAMAAFSAEQVAEIKKLAEETSRGFLMEYDEKIQKVIDENTPSVTSSIRGLAGITESKLTEAQENIDVMRGTVEAMRLECARFGDEAREKQESLQPLMHQADLQISRFDSILTEQRGMQDKAFSYMQEQLGNTKSQIDPVASTVETRMHEAKTYIDGMADKVKAELSEARTTTSGGGLGFGTQDGLVNWKELTVNDLVEGMSKEQFVHWRGCVELFIDNVPSRKHYAAVLAFMRESTGPITKSIMSDAIRYANREGQKIYEIGQNHRDKTVELYSFILPRLSQEYRSMCSSVMGNDGFQVRRLVNQGKDITFELSERDLKTEVLAIRGMKATIIKGTKKMLNELMARSKLYVEKIGKPIDEEGMSRTLWKAMDPATQDIAMIMKVNAGSAFQEMATFVEERYTMYMYRTTGTG